MRVISLRLLREFWLIHPEAESALRGWYREVCRKSVDWVCWADVRATFATASHVGDFIIFNVGGNKYRVAATVNYRIRRVYIDAVMTHREYDRWKP